MNRMDPQPHGQPFIKDRRWIFTMRINVIKPSITFLLKIYLYVLIHGQQIMMLISGDLIQVSNFVIPKVGIIGIDVSLIVDVDSSLIPGQWCISNILINKTNV